MFALRHRRGNPGAGRIGCDAMGYVLAVAFVLAVNWFLPMAHAQVCTVANTIASIPAPADMRQMIYAPTHGRLVVRNSGSAITTIDLATGVSAVHASNTTFTDMAISPSGRYVFGADYGGENIGYGTPRTQSYVHRLDLSNNTWETRTAYIAGGIQAVSDEQFILKSIDQWVTFTNNTWGTGTSAVILNTPADPFGGPGYSASVYFGDFRYDANRGRLLHGNSGSSSQEIQAFRFAGNNFVKAEGTGTYGSAQGHGGGVALATDGSAFYYGRLQVDPLDVSWNRRVFGEPIYAATGAVAFGNGKFFDASNGNLMGSLGFDTTVYALNPNGTDFWALDSGQNLLRHMTFTTAPCGTPPAPIGVSAEVPPGTKNIVISWTGSTGATGYNIYMAKQPGVIKANHLTLGGQSRLNVANPHTEFAATAGTYYLVVTAFNALGESVESAQVLAVVPDTQAPSVPTGLTATVVNSSRIDVSWNASSDDSGINHYQIYRDSSYFWTVFAPQLSFSDTGVAGSTVYRYSVAACDVAFNCSAQTPTVSATTPVRVTLDVTPDPFSFVLQAGAPRSSIVVSNSIVVTGIGAPAPISITGGEYSINGGAFTSIPGTVTNGQSVVVRVTSPATYSTTTTATLGVGDFSASFTVMTAPGPIHFAAQYLPLALGNSWVRSRNGVIGTISTISGQIVNGFSTVGILDESDGSITYYSNDGLGLRMHRTFFPPSFVPGCGTVAETDTYGPPLTILPVGGTIGQIVPSNGVLTADGGACGVFPLAYTASSTLEAVERVTVPAGQFDALRVRLAVSIAIIGSRSATVWLASGIGQVKAIDADGAIEELVSTSIVRTTPDEMLIPAQSNAPRSSSVVSTPVAISGITAPAAVSISGGEYSIDGGAFTNLPGSVSNSQSIQVRLTSSAQGLTSTSATLTVGGVASLFTVTTGVGAPGAPTAVTASAGSGSITVSFGAPANSGGAAITGYTATCTSSDGGTAGSGSAVATFIHVGGLTNGKRYTCTVTASNAAGAGTASAPSNAIAPFDLTPILNLLLN